MHGQSFEPCQIHARPGLERLRAVESIDSGSYTRVTVGSSGGAQNATDKKAYGASKLTLTSQTSTALKDIFMNNQKRMQSDAALWTQKGKPSVDKLRDSVKEHEDELLKIQADTAMKGCEAITKLLTPTSW